MSRGRGLFAVALVLSLVSAVPAGAAEPPVARDGSEQRSSERIPVRIAARDRSGLAAMEPAPGTVGLTSAAIYDLGDGTALVVAEVKNNTTRRRVGATVQVRFYDDQDQFLGVTYSDTIRVERLSYGGRSPFWITVGLPEGTALVEADMGSVGTATTTPAVGGLTVTPTGSTVEADTRTWTATVTNPLAFAVESVDVHATLYDSEGDIVDAWVDTVAEIPAGGSAPVAIEMVDDPAVASVGFVAEGNRVGAAGYVTSWNNYFDDIGNISFRSSIVWLAEQRITGGCGSGRYCPLANVRRDEMAAFLARALGLTGIAPDAFVDDEGNTHERNIDRVAAAGITGGCDAAKRLYCPANPVRRDQMASFLSRALGLTGTPPDAFTDDAGNTHERNINRIAAAGITGGCGPTTYCPAQPVTRGQMAAFLRRAFGD